MIDGPLRAAAALDGRRSGLSPAYNLGEAAIKYIVLQNESYEANTGALVNTSGN